MVPHISHGAHAAMKRRREILDAFRQKRATSAGAATTLEAIGLKPDRMLQQMQHQEVLRALPGGRLYLDEDRLEQQRSTAVRVAVMVAFVVIVVFVTLIALQP